ncbi:MAG TPA: hypothetical protein VJB16_06205, partial [archaeon]|nr:hypothetical protein [archaeon]
EQLANGGSAMVDVRNHRGEMLYRNEALEPLWQFPTGKRRHLAECVLVPWGIEAQRPEEADVEPARF